MTKPSSWSPAGYSLLVDLMVEQMIALKLPTVSFGATSAIVTSMGVIIGFGAGGISKSTIIAGLLIVGLADNLTDSLSIHIYRESENSNNALRSEQRLAILQLD